MIVIHAYDIDINQDVVPSELKDLKNHPPPLDLYRLLHESVFVVIYAVKLGA